MENMNSNIVDIVDIVEAPETGFRKRSISQITSDLIYEIEERQKFIQTVEEYLFKDWDMTPESMYKLASFLGGNYLFENIANSLQCEAAKMKHPPAMVYVARLCRETRYPQIEETARLLVDDAYALAREICSPNDKLQVAWELALFSRSSEESNTARELAEEALALGADDKDRVFKLICDVAERQNEKVTLD